VTITGEADDGSRTRDLRLGKPTLYQLSYVRRAPILANQQRARAASPTGRIRLDLGMNEHLRREIREEHLLIRLPLTAVGAVIAIIGSFMDWTHGLTGAAGPIADGGIGGDGKYTALLALAVLACAAWYVARPQRRPALALAIASAILFFVSVGEWNSVSDDVQSANHDNLLFATASVGAGSLIVMLGAVLALVGSVWTIRIDR
jgi:hypothetical protein